MKTIPHSLLSLSKNRLIKISGRVRTGLHNHIQSLVEHCSPKKLVGIPIKSPVLSSVYRLLKTPFASVTTGLGIFRSIKNIIRRKIDLDLFNDAYEKIQKAEENIKTLQNLRVLNVSALESIFAHLESLFL